MPDQKVYLDFNATTPIDESVISVIEESCRMAWGNPSSNYLTGKTAKAVVEKARFWSLQIFKPLHFSVTLINPSFSEIFIGPHRWL